jgi:SAM-dependent MidA family methyltransferase
LLRFEIERSGPITFDRFMQRALYEPGLGYYATSRQRTTREGDFLTAPELHPLFGYTVARQIDEMWRRLGEPAAFTLREYGAGSGTLGQAIQEGLMRDGSPLADVLRYEPIDVGAGAPGEPLIGCVLANEFVDALPVHLLVVQGGELREVHVGWRDGRFVEESGNLSDERIAEWFAGRQITLAEGQRAEVNLAMLDWLGAVAAQLQRGFVLAFDYGASASELYAPSRFDGTVRAFRAHHVGSDVLAGVGRQDLTAHVDLDALEAGARLAGLDVLGRTTQAEFLIGCGLEDVLARERELIGEDWPGQLLLRSTAGRQLDPRQLGGYAAVVLGRGVAGEPALRGLGYRVH